MDGTNVRNYYKYAKEFKKTFSVPLSRFLRINTPRGILLGFDVIGFDTWLETPDGVSTKDLIGKKYGDEAVKLVEGLL